MQLSDRHWSCGACAWRAQSALGIPLLAPELAAEAEGFDPRYFSDLIELESHNFWFRARNKLIVWAIGRYFASADSMLEIGCGTGFVLSAIGQARPRLRLSASEVLVQGLQRSAARLRNVEFLQMDARHIPFREEFDLIGAFDVLEHIDDDEAVLREAHRALKPGGGLLLTVPQHPSLWSAADEYAFHRRRYGRRDLCDKVERAGFRILRCTAFVCILLPLLFVSRFTKRDVSTFDPRAEFRLPPAVNWTLERLLDFERQFVRAGLNLPVGGSLLLAACKA